MTLGAAAVAAPLLMLHAAAPASGFGWKPGLLLLAWLCASSAFGWGLVTARSPVDADAGPPRQALSASIIGAGVIVAQWLALAAAGLPAWGTPAESDSVSAGTLVMLASLGGAELLLLMLLASAVESRMRRRLDKARHELEAHAQRDELTSLPNRPAFESVLAQAQINADAEHGQVALLLVALDGFKHVNEAFNHQLGDRLLQRVALRLRGMVEPQSVARLGGDEFLMLVQGPQATVQAIALAAQVIDVVAQPCNLDGRDIAIGCSVGLACYPQHGSMSALITHAGVAMRAAKSAGGATYSIFDPRMVVDVREQAELLRDLRMALSRGQLELYYQPKIHAPSAADHRGRGAAALAPSAARHHQPDGVHPDGRTQWPDQLAGCLGHRRSLPPGARLARPGPAHARGRSTCRRTSCASATCRSASLLRWPGTRSIPTC